MPENTINVNAMSAMDWLTFAIAVAGFILSATIWAKELVSQRKNLSGRILDITVYNNFVVLRILFENRSRLPIAITQIELVINGQRFACSQTPKLVFERMERTNGKVTESTKEFSVRLPIQIAELGANESLVFFGHLPATPQDDATHLTLRLSTNRGKPIEMRFELPAGWADRKTEF